MSPRPRPWQFLAAILVCAGCGSPPADPPATSAAATTTSSSTAGSRPVALAALQPCELITDTQARMFGYTGHTPHPTGRGCVYLDTADGSWTYATGRSLTFEFLPGGVATLQPAPTDTVSAETVGEHQAVRIQSASAPTCTVAIDINGAETVTVQAGRQPSAADACTHALTAAKQIEHLLP